MKDDTLNIYWAPYCSHEQTDWNMLYHEPTNLFDELKQDVSPGLKTNNFLLCPSVGNKFKNTFVFRNTLHSRFNFDKDDNINVLNKENNYVKMTSLRKSTIKNTSMLNYNMQWIFFSEEPVVADFTPPYFHEPKYMKYGAIVPGEMNIGLWFRPYNAEIITWREEGEIEFLENEPLMYVKFNTDKKINLIKFNMNNKLNSYANACVNSTVAYGQNIPLIKRYERFKKSKLNELILNEIRGTLNK